MEHFVNDHRRTQQLVRDCLSEQTQSSDGYD